MASISSRLQWVIMILIMMMIIWPSYHGATGQGIGTETYETRCLLLITLVLIWILYLILFTLNSFWLFRNCRFYVVCHVNHCTSSGSVGLALDVHCSGSVFQIYHACQCFTSGNGTTFTKETFSQLRTAHSTKSCSFWNQHQHNSADIIIPNYLSTISKWMSQNQ